MSCLFRALGYFIKENEQILRQRICNYLQLNKTLAHLDASTFVQWDTQMAIDDYVRCMRQDHTWGGAIEIQAFCELYGLPITCVDQRTGKKFQYVPLKENRQGTDRITLLWQGANHYEPLVK